MKTYFWVTILALSVLTVSCGGAEEEVTDDNTDENVVVFSAEDYYYEVLDGVLQVDEKLRYVQSLDEKDAGFDTIKAELDSMLIYVEEGRKTLDGYQSDHWPERDSLDALTEEWFGGVQFLVNEYFYKLAEPMSRPDDTWTEQDKFIYAAYEEAIYEFYDTDEKWVSFQEVYAAANGFELIDDDDVLN